MNLRSSINPGQYHLDHNISCQDYYGKDINENTASVCLCDGASFSLYGGTAAELLSEKLPVHLQNNFIRYLAMDPLEIKWEMNLYIQKILRMYAAEHQVEPKLLASTIMAVSVAKYSGNFIAFHLGDGRMLWKKNPSDEFKLMSGPINGGISSVTPLTMNSNMLQTLKFIRWRKASAKEFLLMTDGLDSLEEEQKYNFILHGIKPDKTPFDDYSYTLFFE